VGATPHRKPQVFEAVADTFGNTIKSLLGSWKNMFNTMEDTANDADIQVLNLEDLDIALRRNEISYMEYMNSRANGSPQSKVVIYKDEYYNAKRLLSGRLNPLSYKEIAQILNNN
jgi:hypothetical protein